MTNLNPHADQFALCGETRYVAFGFEPFALCHWLCQTFRSILRRFSRVIADGSVLRGGPTSSGQSNVNAVACHIDALPHNFRVARHSRRRGALLDSLDLGVE